MEARNEVAIITPDVTEAAEYIGTAWRQGVESIIETGKRLIETRDRFKDERGKWSMLVGDHQYVGKGLLPFAKSHAYRLISISESPRLLPHVGALPSDAYTLYQLTRLSTERFDQLLEDGSIHPGMKRNEASASIRCGI